MSVVTNTGFDNQAASGVYTSVNLAKYEFATGPLFLAAYPLNIVAFGETFQGVKKFSMSGLKESEDGGPQKHEHYLNPLKESLLAYAMGDPSVYMDRPVTVWLAMLDPATGQLAGEPVVRFKGVMATTHIERKKDKSRIKLICRSGSYDETSDPDSLRYTNAQQQFEYTGDRGMEQVPQLVGKARPWLSERFQQQR